MYKTSAYVKSLGLITCIFKLLGDFKFFISTYVVFYILNNFIKLFLGAINPKFSKDFESEGNLIDQTIGEEALDDYEVEKEFDDYKNDINKKVRK